LEKSKNVEENKRKLKEEMSDQKMRPFNKAEKEVNKWNQKRRRAFGMV